MVTTVNISMLYQAFDDSGFGTSTQRSRYFWRTMTPDEIVAKFVHSLDNFEPIVGQPSDSNLTRLREAVAPILLQIPYEETGAVHNLINLICPEYAYVAHYGNAFPEPA